MGGDIRETIANGSSLKDKLQKAGVLISKYSYGGGLFNWDTYNGLSMAIHGWTGIGVEVTNYIKKGDYYKGTLTFTFWDNFGLDAADIESGQNEGIGAGFRAWYILQHYDEYKGKYRPFQDFVEISHDFSGLC